MAYNIEELQIQIEGESKSASANIEKLTKSLQGLKNAVGVGTNFAGLSRVALALQPLNNLKINVSGLSKIAQSMAAIEKTPDITAKIKSIVDAGNAFQNLGKNNLNSFLSSLKRLPEMSKMLSEMDIGKFAFQIKLAANAIKPLANEMEKVSNGFKAFPIRIQKIIASNQGLTASNKSTGSSFNLFGNGLTWALAKLNLYYISVKRVAHIMGDWVNESNKYQENLNLFSVTMGDAAEGAFKYAKAVEDALGVDSSEWMRNQGVFKQILSGFGVIEDKANMMSRNLTQLIYDSASFFNTSIETATQKFQSGIAGELEPLRRWGYALDLATLQQIALNHGITQSFNTMTQAQKSLLRYIAIMEQSNNVFGDMARTIETPANALRILDQRITMLKRASGNAMIPLLIEVIPYVQAFTQVLTEAATALATFLGFKITKVDYSQSTDNVAALSDEYGELEKEAKAAKRALLGIDEIHVLNKPDVSTGTDNGTQYDLNIALPDYDNWLGEVQGKSKKVYEEVRQTVKDLEPIIAGFLLLFAGNKILSGVTAIGEFVKKSAPIQGLLVNMGVASENGVKGIKKLNEGFKGFRSELSKTSKLLIGAGGTIMNFLTFKDSMYGLASGTTKLKDELPKLIGVFASVGVAMYAALGPVGLVLAAVGALGGALVGLGKAAKERILGDLFVDVGLSASDLNLLTEELGTTIIEFNGPLKEYKTNMQLLTRQYNELARSFSSGSQLINKSAGSTNEDINGIMEKLTTMTETARTKLESQTELAMKTYRKLALENDDIIDEEEQKVLDAMDKNLEEKKTRLQGIQDEIKKIFENAMTERGYLLDDEIKNINKLMDAQAKIANFDALVAQNKSKTMISDISSGKIQLTEDNITSILESVKANFDRAKDEAGDAKATQEALYQTTLPEGAALNKALKDVNDQYEKQMQVLSDDALAVLNAVKTQLYEKIPKGKREEYYDSSFMRGVASFGANIGAAFGNGYSERTIEYYGIKDFLTLLDGIEKNMSYGAKTSSNGNYEKMLDWKTMQNYATGGFVDSAQLFFANENGNIEAMGKMGNDTVVANNEQIVTGITQGVKKAIQETGGLNNGGDWHIQIIDTAGNVKGDTIITAAQRKNRRDGKTVIPLGV